jgi:hypothetical protein
MIHDRKLAYGVIPALWAIVGVLIAVQSSALALAVDLAAAERAFASDLAKLPKSTPVLSGWSGVDSNVAEFSVERVMDPVTWHALWARHAPDTPPPPVDFAHVMVVAIFTGTVPASLIPSVNLLDATEQDRIDITVKYFLNDVVTNVRANHYLIVVLRPSSKPIRVVAHSYALMRTPREREDVWKELDGIDATK